MEVEQWGEIGWVTMEEAFEDASNLTVSASDTPDLSAVESMQRMFEGAEALSGEGANWDWETGNVTDMRGMFRNAEVFDEDIGGWDVSSVTDMGGMFARAFSFD